MGHVVNPVNFRLGTVRIWNSNTFSNKNNLKYNGYFAVISYNIYFFLSKVFRSRFFAYVTSFLFSHVKLFSKYNKILCFIFLFNGASEFGGYKTTSLISFFFPKEKKIFKEIKKNINEVKKDNSISIFPSRFFFETGFSYNFFYNMWINKKLRYYGIYKPIMIDQIKRDGYKFLFKTKVSPESSTFQRFLFKHMMYKRKELRKKWNKINNKKIKIKKHFRKFFLKKFLKYIYYIPLKKRNYKKLNKNSTLVSLKYYRNLNLFKKFVHSYGDKRIKKFIKLRYKNYRFFNKTNTKIKNSKEKFKFRCFPGRKISRSFKIRNFLFQEPVFRSKGKRLKKRTYILDLHNKFKFLLNKVIKRLKFTIYKIFLKKLINICYFLNILFVNFLNLKRKPNTIFYFIYISFFNRKKKLQNLFKKGLNKINKNKFKIDLMFAKIMAFNLEMVIFKYSSWNLQKKLRQILEKIFKGFNFKIQYHFLDIKNINAKIISYYISVRLKQKYRIAPILRDVKRYCNIAKKVRGWKLTCAGRFSKKEIASYIVLKGGSFGYSSITSLLDFSFNSVVLKYSICGIKVWFVLKKNFKRVLSFKSNFSKILLEKTLKKNKKIILKKFFKKLKKLIKSKSEKKKILELKLLCFFNFKNFFYKRIFTKSKGFWGIWRLFLKKYKFIF